MVLNMGIIHAILFFSYSLLLISAQTFVNVNLGEEVTLECHTGESNTVTLWNRYEMYCPQIIWGEADENQNDRLQMTSNATTSILKLRNVQYADQGTYRCNSLEDYSKISEFTLVVQTGSKYDQKKIKEHHSTVLECLPNSTIDPTQQVVWTRENNKSLLPSGKYIREGNTTLELHKVSRKDAGTYSCGYRRENGTIKIKKIDLLVKYGPIIQDFGISEIISQPTSCPVEEISVPQISINNTTNTSSLIIDYPKINVIWREFDKELKCLVEAYPEPDIFWYKDNTRLINNMHYRVALRKLNATFMESYLKMIWSDETNNGSYKCFASNYISNTSSTEIAFIRNNTKTAGNTANFKTAASIFVVIGCILFHNYL